jgi:hypothetical protein
MRRAGPLALLLLAALPAAAGAQACLGRPERGHTLVSAGFTGTDAFTRRSLGLATHNGSSSAQISFTDPELWRRPLRYHAFEATFAWSTREHRGAGTESAALATTQSARRGGSCWVAGVRSRSEPRSGDFADPGAGDTQGRYSQMRYVGALGWGRQLGATPLTVQPFAHAGVAVDYEYLNNGAGDRIVRVRPGGYVQGGVGMSGAWSHLSAAVSYAPGLPRYSLVHRHNWMVLTLQMALLIGHGRE